MNASPSIPPLPGQQTLPRLRTAGPVVLDLLYRDARAEGGWLYLRPREFGLLWRLAAEPGAVVSRQDLLADVWRLRHDPGSNSIEVHIYRLRARLADHGITGLIETGPQGGYRLALDPAASAPSKPISAAPQAR